MEYNRHAVINGYPVRLFIDRVAQEAGKKADIRCCVTDIEIITGKKATDYIEVDKTYQRHHTASLNDVLRFVKKYGTVDAESVEKAVFAKNKKSKESKRKTARNYFNANENFQKYDIDYGNEFACLNKPRVVFGDEITPPRAISKRRRNVTESSGEEIYPESESSEDSDYESDSVEVVRRKKTTKKNEELEVIRGHYFRSKICDDRVVRYKWKDVKTAAGNDSIKCPYPNVYVGTSQWITRESLDKSFTEYEIEDRTEMLKRFVQQTPALLTTNHTPELLVIKKEIASPISVKCITAGIIDISEETLTDSKENVKKLKVVDAYDLDAEEEYIIELAARNIIRKRNGNQ